jgi:hypothetical protein
MCVMCVTCVTCVMCVMCVTCVTCVMCVTCSMCVMCVLVCVCMCACVYRCGCARVRVRLCVYVACTLSCPIVSCRALSSWMPLLTPACVPLLQVVLRVPGSAATAKDLECDIAIHRFVRENTTVPVPRVVAWSGTRRTAATKPGAVASPHRRVRCGRPLSGCRRRCPLPRCLAS